MHAVLAEYLNESNNCPFVKLSSHRQIHPSQEFKISKILHPPHSGPLMHAHVCDGGRVVHWVKVRPICNELVSEERGERGAEPKGLP